MRVARNFHKFTFYKNELWLSNQLINYKMHLHNMYFTIRRIKRRRQGEHLVLWLK